MVYFSDLYQNHMCIRIEMFCQAHLTTDCAFFEWQSVNCCTDEFEAMYITNKNWKGYSWETINHDDISLNATFNETYID